MRRWHGWALLAVGVALALGLEWNTVWSAQIGSAMLLAATLYASSHLLRALRIVFLLGHGAVSVRGIVAAHLVEARVDIHMLHVVYAVSPPVVSPHIGPV